MSVLGRLFSVRVLQAIIETRVRIRNRTTIPHRAYATHNAKDISRRSAFGGFL